MIFIFFQNSLNLHLMSYFLLLLLFTNLFNKLFRRPCMRFNNIPELIDIELMFDGLRGHEPNI